MSGALVSSSRRSGEGRGKRQQPDWSVNNATAVCTQCRCVCRRRQPPVSAPAVLRCYSGTSASQLATELVRASVCGCTSFFFFFFWTPPSSPSPPPCSLQLHPLRHLPEPLPPFRVCSSVSASGRVFFCLFFLMQVESTACGVVDCVLLCPFYT